MGQEERVGIPIFLPWHLFRAKPEMIISGNMGPTSLMCLVVTKLLGVPFVIWTEEIKETAGEISSIQKFLRSILLPRTTAFLAWGKPAKDHILNQGISEEKLYYCAQAVDSDWWIEASKSCDPKAIKSQLKLKGRVYLLIGQLIPRKGFDNVIVAWSKLSQGVQMNNHLLIVGQGESEYSLKQLAHQLRIPNILFTGQKTQEELVELFAAADIFVFPSIVDVWGMVVNEAMASGLPVLASKYAGASQELLSNKKYGALFDPLDIDSITDLLEKWVNIDLPDPVAIQKRIKEVNYEVTLKSFIALFQNHLIS
jgi:glycosyltransferase involved in cell wall biosynthesis